MKISAILLILFLIPVNASSIVAKLDATEGKESTQQEVTKEDSSPGETLPTQPQGDGEQEGQKPSAPPQAPQPK